jgi:hypothetical protein
MQWLEGTKKERVLGQDLGLGGEVKAENAQGRCRGVGRDMVEVGSKFGARRQPVSEAGNKKVVVTKRAKRERVTRTKKNDKNQKNPLTKKNGFFFGGAKLASTPWPPHKAPSLALWTTGAS